MGITDDASCDRTSLTRSGWLLLVLYLPSLVQSFTESPVISGHRFCMVAVTEVKSELILSSQGVSCWHSGMPYITILNFLSDADSLVLVCVVLKLNFEPGTFSVVLPVFDRLLVLVVEALWSFGQHAILKLTNNQVILFGFWNGLSNVNF